MQSRAPGATREDQHSLAPIQLEATSLEHDLAMIKRGQGRRLLLALLGTTLTMAGLLLWMKSSDARHAYMATAKQLDSIHAEQAAAFEQCALLQPQASRQALRSAIEVASQTHRKAYGEQLAPCSQALVILARRLDGVDVPLSMEHRVESLRRSADALNRAIGSYRSYLQDPKLGYDFLQATPHIDQVMHAWGNYENQEQHTLDALRAAGQTR